MTTKDKYVKMRNSQKLDNAWLWEYYKSEGGKMTDVNQFIENFYIVQEPINVHGQTVGYQRANRDLNNFFSDMDKKFGLTTLWQQPKTEKNVFGQDVKMEEFIKVVE